MEIRKYIIKRIFKPSVTRRAKAMRKAKKERSKAALEARSGEISALQTRLGYEFKDLSILNEALTHPGSVGISKKVKSNQRLEFLGDAILQSIITSVPVIKSGCKKQIFTALRFSIDLILPLSKAPSRISLFQVFGKQKFHHLHSPFWEHMH